MAASAASDLALNKLSPSLVAKAIRATRDVKVALYVRGAPGISKSAIARQVADDLGIAYIDFRLSQMAPEDLRGVPMLTETNGIKGMVWTPPLCFPRDLDYEDLRVVNSTPTTLRFHNPVGDNGIPYCSAPRITVQPVQPEHSIEVSDITHNSFVVRLADGQGNPASGPVRFRVAGKARAILALDEFNSAPPSVMTASYQLVLDRRLGDYMVPDGVSLVAMGNRDCDKGITSRLVPPVANRFVHIEMEVNFDDWLGWAVREMVHPDVIGFLSKWRSRLLDFNPSLPAISFATPRSWEFVSKIIKGDTPPEVLSAMICGAVGDSVGTEFIAHRKYMADMPDIEAILDGKVTSFTPSKKQFATQIAYSTAMQMLYALKLESEALNRKHNHDRVAINQSAGRKEWCARADRAIGYMMDNFQLEITVVALRCALLNHRLPFSSSSMMRFVALADEFHDLMGSAI